MWILSGIPTTQALKEKNFSIFPSEMMKSTSGEDFSPVRTDFLPLLTEAELAVFRRGRNAQVHSVPQHASRAQYGTATALEALFGWLYLSGQRQRASDLFETMMEDEVCR